MCNYWRWLKMTGSFFLNEQMKRIPYNWTKSIISTFSGETAHKNADNLWFPILNSCQELNPDQRSLSLIVKKLKCCQYNKGFFFYCPTSATISMKPIQIPSAPIKPCEYLDHHQVGTWTLKFTRWNRTTEKLISPSFDILDSVRLISCQMFILFW